MSSLFIKVKEFTKRKVVSYNKGEISLNELKEYLPDNYELSFSYSGYVELVVDRSRNNGFNIVIYDLHENFDDYMEELKYTARNYNAGKITSDEFLAAFRENDEGFVGNFVYGGKKVIKVVGNLYEYFTEERLV